MDDLDKLSRLLAHPADIAAFAVTQPAFSLALAAVIALLVVVARRTAAGRASAATGSPAVAPDSVVLDRYRPELTAVAVGAAVVVAAFALEYLLTGWVLPLVDVVEWWRYATPVFTAALVEATLLALIMLRRVPPTEPVRGAMRRTWRSFGARGLLLGGAAAIAVLVVTTVLAGLASSSDDRGRFIHLEVPIPNASIDAMRPWFYGWSFGVPVLVCTTALIVLGWLVLRGNAARPFLRPGTMAGETAARSAIANGTIVIAGSAALLALGGAWRFIARSGGFSTLMVGDDPTEYQAVWQHQALGEMLGWLAPVVEIAGFVALLLLVRRPSRVLASRPTRRADASTRAALDATPSAHAEPAR